MPSPRSVLKQLLKSRIQTLEDERERMAKEIAAQGETIKRLQMRPSRRTPVALIHHPHANIGTPMSDWLCVDEDSPALEEFIAETVAEAVEKLAAD